MRGPRLGEPRDALRGINPAWLCLHNADHLFVELVMAVVFFGRIVVLWRTR